MGPHALLGNNPRSIEFNVEWITDLMQYMKDRDLTRAEATPEAVASWHEYVLGQGEGLLTNQVDSWMTGINSNLEGRQKRIIARSEEHTSELQSQAYLVCRLLLEKKNTHM